MEQQLKEEKARLEGELSRFAKPSGDGGFETTIENIGDDEDENATEAEQYVDNLALEATLETQLRDVNDALLKIEAGNYGICEETGKEISEDRLRAYPAARTVIA